MVFYVLGMVLYFLDMLTAKVRLYLSGTTNEHKFALTEGSASQYPSGLKIPRMTLKQTSFRGQPKVTQVSPTLLPKKFHSLNDAESVTAR